MSKILDNLYLGCYEDAKNEKFLKRSGITHIVTVGVELQTIYPKLYKYLYIPAYDNPSYKLNVYFDQIADFIHNAIENEKGVVFVHCFMGISRSATSIIAYLIKHLQWPLLKARNFLKIRRTITNPNEGFMRQLVHFARRHGVVDDHDSINPSKLRATLPKSSGSAKQPEENKVSDLQQVTQVTYMRPNSISEMKTRVGSFLATTRAAGVEHDYHCRNCGVKVFNDQDVLHSGDKKTDSACQSIYLKHMPWMGYSRTNSAKLFCPNVKCGQAIGFTNKNGGKCSCGKPIENMHVVYPAKVAAAKPKSLPSKAL